VGYIRHVFSGFYIDSLITEEGLTLTWESTNGTVLLSSNSLDGPWERVNLPIQRVQNLNRVVGPKPEASKFFKVQNKE